MVAGKRKEIVRGDRLATGWAGLQFWRESIKMHRMWTAMDIIAERRIAEAIENGEMRGGSLRGKPLPPDDCGHVPAELRMAYKILKNSGFLPPEIEARKEIEKIEELLAATDDEQLRLRQMKKLEVLLLKINAMRDRPVNLEADRDYFRKVVERVPVNGG